jgi:hypothetical protein
MSPAGRLAYRFVGPAITQTGNWSDYEDMCKDELGGGARAARESVAAFLASQDAV